MSVVPFQSRACNAPSGPRPARSLLILILTGVYLTLFFHPSTTEVAYHGSYIPLQGQMMSEAYKSTLDISFDIRGGLLIRQLHR
ncbi:hypothetical protein IQ64_47315 [Streptomyces stelliscabiei]|uniref:Cytochrome bc1 complex cytochrome b subunit n=1 Tax=Streptomyces stelliscabiei TaxID=146820 RepID=A0A8I0TN90_9ACTN|nr:hypothetical protein IQ64_47315 [Streptomyces stelliscabiei]MBE1593962.1 ubiquinol-cytochrome c reductase cytochrome b subunit [Streptomyces stelliscabiei]